MSLLEKARGILPCFQFVKRMNGNLSNKTSSKAISTCFQFVKRMNGNIRLANSVLVIFLSSCFQFVKRMNGNPECHQSPLERRETLLPIREAYEWKQLRRTLSPAFGFYFLLPIREAYEWKQCVGSIHELTLQFF